MICKEPGRSTRKMWALSVSRQSTLAWAKAVTSSRTRSPPLGIMAAGPKSQGSNASEEKGEVKKGVSQRSTPPPLLLPPCHGPREAILIFMVFFFFFSSSEYGIILNY